MNKKHFYQYKLKIKILHAHLILREKNQLNKMLLSNKSYF